MYREVFLEKVFGEVILDTIPIASAYAEASA